MNTQLGVLSANDYVSDRRLTCSMTCTCVENETGDFLFRYGLRFKRLSKTIREFPDVTGNAKTLRDFMLSLNRNRVSEHHLDDVIEDFLALSPD